MHRYSDLSALAAVLSRRTLTRMSKALSLKQPSSNVPLSLCTCCRHYPGAASERITAHLPTVGAQIQAYVGRLVTVVLIYKALVAGAAKSPS